jgi:hypothetical protein
MSTRSGTTPSIDHEVSTSSGTGAAGAIVVGSSKVATMIFLILGGLRIVFTATQCLCENERN